MASVTELLSFTRNFISRRTLTSHSRACYRLFSKSPSSSAAAATGDVAPLLQTPLHEFHVARGGKMVPFAGWSMPVQYSDLTVINSSLHTRQHASIFDVSHMLQTEVTGKDAGKFLEYITVANLVDLKDGRGTLSMFTTAQGGIIDDCIITRTGPLSFFVVSNAGRADVVKSHIENQLKEFSGNDIVITSLDERALVALQGPQSGQVLQQGVQGDLNQLKFMNSSLMDVFSISNCRVSRCGYTGEDGFEISVAKDKVVQLVETLLSSNVGTVKLAGLGARDVLRLEAGLCLYGNDISEETTPIEASLAWCIDKRRRIEGEFLGAGPILQQLKDKPLKRRVGLQIGSGPPARQGCQVFDANGENVGVVTSGTLSPTLKANIAMVYLPRQLCKVGTEVTVQVRKHSIIGKVVKMPFVPSNYFV